MGGANLAEAKLRDFIALSVPSMALNYRNGWRGVWLVYYDDPTHAKYPAGYIERLTEALKELPFAAALPAAIKGSGGGQRYQFTGELRGRGTCHAPNMRMRSTRPLTSPSISFSGCLARGRQVHAAYKAAAEGNQGRHVP
eukprot:scaffold1387_cov260-Pinguiococcus_pyrenoidosus.AAC.18